MTDSKQYSCKQSGDHIAFLDIVSSKGQFTLCKGQFTRHRIDDSQGKSQKLTWKIVGTVLAVCEVGARDLHPIHSWTDL